MKQKHETFVFKRTDGFSVVYKDSPKFLSMNRYAGLCYVGWVGSFCECNRCEIFRSSEMYRECRTWKHNRKKQWK